MIFGLEILTFCAGVVFATSLAMNLLRKNTMLITFYFLQSIVVALALIELARTEDSLGLIYAAALTLAVKAVMAPAFLLRLIRLYSAHFSAASYLSVPLTLVSLATLTGFSYIISSSFAERSLIALLFATILAALFLMINRRGALSAVVGILALENGVVLLSAMLGAVHTVALEFTIAFDIAVWIAIASVFLTMLYRQFGMVDTDTSLMTRLTEE